MSAGFVYCPDCKRLMLGQNGRPQPHDCPDRPTATPDPVTAHGDQEGGGLVDSAEKDALTTVLREHRPDGWACTCGWPLNDSIGSVIDHLAAQIRPLMRCSDVDCRLFPGHDGDHGDGGGIVWATRAIPPEQGNPDSHEWLGMDR